MITSITGSSINKIIAPYWRSKRAEGFDFRWNLKQSPWWCGEFQFLGGEIFMQLRLASVHWLHSFHPWRDCKWDYKKVFRREPSECSFKFANFLPLFGNKVQHLPRSPSADSDNEDTRLQMLLRFIIEIITKYPLNNDSKIQSKEHMWNVSTE